MNILFIIGIYPNIGGTEQVTTVLANRFVAEGHSVTIVSYKQGSLELLETLDRFVKFHALSFPPLRLSNYKTLRRILIEERIEVIINQWGWALPHLLVCRLAARRTEIKLLSVFHLAPGQASLVERLKRDMLQQPLNQLKRLCKCGMAIVIDLAYRFNFSASYFLSHRCVLLSERNIPEFQNYAWGASPRKMVAIPNPLTREKEKSLNGRQKKKQLLYVGRLEITQKRVDRILKLWQNLAPNFPDWNLVIAGDGPDAELLKETARNLDLPRVTFLGYCDPAEAYAESEILILTSEYESFGLVILEGMLYGVVPIVYGNYAAIDEVISNGKDGVIVHPPFQELEFQSHLQLLMEMPEVRIQMRQAASEKLEYYSPDRIVGQWNNLIRQL